MQTARLTCSTTERKGTPSAVYGATVQRTRWETAYSTVDWDYPPPPAVYYNALLARGASHSRFLRIAYSSARERSSASAPSPPSPWDSSTSPAHLTATPPSPPPTRKQAVQLLPIPCSLSRPCVNVSPRSANPPSHTLKCRKSQWPKPPHYHASLLRSPLSRRKGLFRAILPPNKAVDFFRWDILLSVGISLSAPRQERDLTRTGGVGACTSLHAAEVVLEPYEAAAGFCGWHGLGLDITRSMQGIYDERGVDECCWGQGTELWRPAIEHDGAGEGRSSDVQREIDEATVDEGRARWARLAEELVGPPGLALRWMVEDGKSSNATTPLDPAHKDRTAFSISSHEEVRWDPDIGSSPFRPPRPTPAPGEKRRLRPSSSTTTILGAAPGSKPEFKPDSPSAWWNAPSQHCGPPQTPHLPSLRHPHPPHVQYMPPPLQIPPYFSGGRIASAQGHGFWYGAQPAGAPPVNRDPNLAKPLPAHHSFVTPVTPRPMHSPYFPWHPSKSSLGRDSDGPGHDCDKETETDRGYESATTTTDSDPPPHTPIGAATTAHCIGARLLGDETDTEHGAATAKIGLSDPTTPVKLLDQFSASSPPSSPDLDQTGYEPSKAAVVFPSLNGSFRQGSLSQVSSSSSNLKISAQTTPAGGVPASLTSPLSSREGSSDGDNSMTQRRHGGLEPSPCPGLQDSPAFTLSLSSPPPTSPRPGLRKDSQGFWEPISPCSSSSSSPLPLSSLEGGETPTTGRIDESKGPAPREKSESPETSGTFPTKFRSMSPGPQRATSVDSTCSSSSRHTTFSSPTTTPASVSVSGGSYPSSPSPSNNPFLAPPNSTTLLPAFLSTTSGKRKKASRTREIVDRLRSSSIDGGKGADNLGWLASPNADGESDGVLDKAPLEPDHLAGNHVVGGQPSPSPATKPRSDSTSCSGSGSGKNHGQVSGSGTFCSSSGSGGKSNGSTTGSEPSTASKTGAIAPRTVTPFPILSVSPTSPSNATMAYRNPSGGTGNAPLNGGDGSKPNVTVSTSPSARSQFLPGSPNDGTSPSTQLSHHAPLSPSHPTAHPPAVLGPPMFAIAAYPHQMYVPYAPYPPAPPHQGQQSQGTWLAVYPGRPVHLPVHPLPAQTSITGVSGMRHVTW